MRYIYILITMCLFTLTSFGSTESSLYAEKQYAKQIGNNNVHIVAKREHTQEYQQKIGDIMVPAVTYGYGDLKVKGCKKTRITYLVLLDSDCKPFWSFIVPSK